MLQAFHIYDLCHRAYKLQTHNVQRSLKEVVSHPGSCEASSFATLAEKVCATDLQIIRPIDFDAHCLGTFRMLFATFSTPH